MEQIEEWRPIDDYEGSYEISSYGRVKSLARVIIRSNGIPWTIPERILKPGHNKGYEYVNLCDKSGHKHKWPHILVAKAFIPNPNNLPCVDHINGIRSDNRVENLRWCTFAENSGFPLARKHNSEAKRGKKNNRYGVVGERHPLSKPVFQYTKDGVFIKSFSCAAEAGRELGIKSIDISSVCRGRPHHHTAGGYIWKFIKE